MCLKAVLGLWYVRTIIICELKFGGPSGVILNSLLDGSFVSFLFESNNVTDSPSLPGEIITPSSPGEVTPPLPSRNPPFSSFVYVPEELRPETSAEQLVSPGKP